MEIHISKPTNDSTCAHDYMKYLDKDKIQKPWADEKKYKVESSYRVILR